MAVIRFSLFTLFFISFTGASLGQKPTRTSEDSLSRPGQGDVSSTTIGGYGNALYQRDFNRRTSTANLERVVLFVGHRFNGDISFISELEMEDAKVSGGEDGGEIAFEQAYLKFSIDPNQYFTAGLFLPRVGILNENHLPTTFNGNARTRVETYILPSTWRELGIGFYGSANSLPLRYSVAIVNGLNSAGFQHGSGIREGRFEGRNASANNLAITGSLQLNQNDFTTQISGYYGGTVGLNAEQADNLGLVSGIFGTPVLIGEADVQYASHGLSARLLGAAVSIPDAFTINRAYSNNTPEIEYGAYAEVAYNILEGREGSGSKQLNLFVRYERLNMNASIPSNGVDDGTLDQHHLVAGLSYLPMNNVVIKADVRFVHARNANPLLTANADYDVNNTFVSVGIGFAF